MEQFGILRRQNTKKEPGESINFQEAIRSITNTSH